MSAIEKVVEPPFAVRPKTVEQLIEAGKDYLDDIKNQPVREHRRYVYVQTEMMIDLCERLLALEARS